MSSSLSGVFIKLARTLAFALASEVLGVAARGETCVRVRVRVRGRVRVRVRVRVRCRGPGGNLRPACRGIGRYKEI